MALGLDDNSNSCHAPAKVLTLGKDLKGKLGNEAFNYLRVIGMMLYLSSHSRPNIQFAVSQCAHFSNNTRASHEKALKWIGQCPKGTQDKGLVISCASEGFNVDCYVDSDFAGLWGSEKPDDPDCATSQTIYVILVCDCPINWS
eukprot:6856690-Ditylum_brightwellii.AAC.1